MSLAGWLLEERTLQDDCSPSFPTLKKKVNVGNAWRIRIEYWRRGIQHFWAQSSSLLHMTSSYVVVMRNREELCSRQWGRGYSWSLFQTNIWEFLYSISGLNSSPKDANDEKNILKPGLAFREHKTFQTQTDKSYAKFQTKWAYKLYLGRRTFECSLQKWVAPWRMIRQVDCLPVIEQYVPAGTLRSWFGRQTSATALFRVAGRSNSKRALETNKDNSFSFNLQLWAK